MLMNQYHHFTKLFHIITLCFDFYFLDLCDLRLIPLGDRQSIPPGDLDLQQHFLSMFFIFHSDIMSVEDTLWPYLHLK